MDHTELCILIRLQISTRTENPIWQAGFPAWVGGMKLSVPTEKTLSSQNVIGMHGWVEIQHKPEFIHIINY